MRKICIILLTFGLLYSQAGAYSLASLRGHKENITYLKTKLDPIIGNDAKKFEKYVENGGKCDRYSSDFREVIKKSYERLEDLTSVNRLDYLTDSKYKDLKEEEVLLNKKKILLQNGGTLTTTQYLSDGTEVIETIEGYNGEYEEDIEDILDEMQDIRKYYKVYATRMNLALGEVRSWLELELLSKCADYYADSKNRFKGQKLETEEENKEHKYSSLYKRLDSIEEKKPGALKKLIPALQELKLQKKYKNYIKIIDVIVNYIKSNF